jgi:ectoine hydroxylase-related dioxygenase (phytanoyl-CoA dioxygenase family)
MKAGVPHVEAPDEVLQHMLTLRIHLDDATEENGPLVVLPGSHTSRDAPATRPAVAILAAAGDVLAMRPLLAHCSGASRASSHRRVIHLEFAGSRELPDGYAWHDFIAGDAASEAAARISSR